MKFTTCSLAVFALASLVTAQPAFYVNGVPSATTGVDPNTGMDSNYAVDPYASYGTPTNMYAQTATAGPVYSNGVAAQVGPTPTSFFGNDNNFIDGHYNNVWGGGNQVQGNGNRLSGYQNGIQGSENIMKGNGNNLRGDRSIIVGNDSRVMGSNTVVNGNRALIKGDGNQAYGNDIWINGQGNQVVGNNNKARGNYNTINYGTPYF